MARSKSNRKTIIKIAIMATAAGVSVLLMWMRIREHNEASLPAGVANVASSTSATEAQDSGTGFFHSVRTFFAAAPEEATLPQAQQAIFWVGLKNSDDVGTQFDLRAEVYQNSTLIVAGEKRCITGVTRNPDRAAQVSVSMQAVADPDFHAGDQLSLKVLTRVGTAPGGTKCRGPGGSHASAIGLRLYYDAASRVSAFTAQLNRDAAARVFVLHTGTSGDFLDEAFPTAKSPRTKDSGTVNFARSNAWAEIGTWRLLVANAEPPSPAPDSSLRSPTAVLVENLWTDAANMFTADGAVARSCPPGAPAALGNFNFSGIGGTIRGIEVQCKASKAAANTCSGGQGGSGNIEIALSWNGGANTTARKDLPFMNGLSETPVVATVGGPTDTWGRTWSPADFSNANFRLLVGHSNNQGTFEVDFCAVRVTSP